MEENLKIEIEKLIIKLGDAATEENLLYVYLKEIKLNNKKKLDNPITKKIENNKQNLQILKHKLLNESFAFIKPELIQEWKYFIEQNINNDYYLNILNIAISIMHKFEQNASNENILIEINKLSELEYNILKCILYYFTNINLEIYNKKVKRKN